MINALHRRVFTPDEEGNMHDISESVLMVDFVSFHVVPTVDELLDWRMIMMILHDFPLRNYSREYYELEILAVDYLLRRFHS